jgi:glycosyltransferase involved in cell wall biosynthesis
VNIQKGVLDRVGNFTSKRAAFKEVIIVDDGSTDSSVSTIKKRYLTRFEKFRLVENNHQGKAIAVITGIQEATSEFVIFTDMDLATPLEETLKIIAEFERGNTIVIGSRAGRREGAPWSRQLQSKGYAMVRNALMGIKGIDDTQCGCKGFKRDHALAIVNKFHIFTKDRQAKGPSVSAAFDLEFLFVARKLGYTICEVPVEWHHAETKRVSLWKDSIETIRDLLRMRLYEFQGKYS